MSVWEAIVLGLVQGLTEFLPISSSGHLELAKALLGVEAADDLTFTVVVHGATVLSTIVVLWRELLKLLLGLLHFKKDAQTRYIFTRFKVKWNDETLYIVKLALSMLPIAVVGFFFRSEVETLFAGNIFLVGVMLLFTAVLLLFASKAPMRSDDKPPTYLSALLMGVGQAVATLPGLSRSGTTISVGILSGTSRKNAAKFSFLMVLPPIIGANLLDLFDGHLAASSLSAGALIAGFLTAFISGVFACKAMLSLVQRRGLRGFAVYCLIVGHIAVMYGLFA